MQNNVYIPFSVSSLEIWRQDNRSIPSGNQNYIFAQFSFAPNWRGLNKTAIFSKDGHEPIHAPIVGDIAQIPNDFMKDIGTITVSVFAGDRRTVNAATIEISQGGYLEGTPLLPPEPAYEYVKTPGGSITLIRESENGQFQYFSRGEWRTVTLGNGGEEQGDGGGATVYADLISNDAENALILGTDNKLYVPQGAMPLILYLARSGNNAVFARDKPTINQTVIDRAWRSAIWGEWMDVATLRFEESLLRQEVEIITGNIVTAKLWLSSDVEIPNAQLRLTITDATDGTMLAIATTTVDLNNINTILTPATFINKFAVSRSVLLSQLQITLSVMVLASGTQFGVITNPPEQLSFITIMAK